MPQPEPAQGQDDKPADASPSWDIGELAEERGGSEADNHEPRLTVAAVARRLGVAPSTLRTWDRRYGLGPSGHTSGRHRRYGPDDIARLELMQRALLRGASPAEAARYAHSTPVPPRPRDGSAGAHSAPEAPETEHPILLSGVLAVEDADVVDLDSTTNMGGRGLRLTGGGPQARGLGRAALSLDSWSQQRILLESIETDGVVTAWREVLRPVLTAIIERRQRTGSGVEALQLLVDCASTALRSVIAHAPAPRNPRPVLLVPVPGEAQELELVALAAALAANRVGHRLFGSALPKEGLEAAVRRSAPAVVVLWSEQAPFASPQVIDDIPITRQRSRVFAAGAGWAPESLPATVEYLESLESAVARVSEALR